MRITDVKGYDPDESRTLRLSGDTTPKRLSYKALGISPAIIDGMCGYRVIYRPFLSEPVPYTKRDGTPGTKRKSDQVCTKWFPIMAYESEEEAFQDAAFEASSQYRETVECQKPFVDWEKLAREKGVKIRTEYAKPALNGARERAAALLTIGYTPRQVAEKLGVDRSTVSRWRKAMNLQKESPQTKSRG